MHITRGQNYGAQRESILAGAAALFAQRGYHGTSMNDVADACGLGKATLYHYYRDKGEVLASITAAHVSRLVGLCEAVLGDATVMPEKRLEVLILRFMDEYSGAQNSHRVLTEDVRFLPPKARARILNKERYVVRAFADAITLARPDVGKAALEKPLAMLLFGMLNWMFTWLRPDGRLTHAEVAPLVTDLFFNGLAGLTPTAPRRSSRIRKVAVTAIKRS